MTTYGAVKRAVGEHPWWVLTMVVLNSTMVYVLFLIGPYLLGFDALYDDPMGLLAMPFTWYPPLLLVAGLSLTLMFTHAMYVEAFVKHRPSESPFVDGDIAP